MTDANPILIGQAERIPPDVVAGDVCEISGAAGLWVPFAGAGGRSDDDNPPFKGWRFLAFPDGDHSRTFQREHVLKIVHHAGSTESVRFWRKVTEFRS